MNTLIGLIREAIHGRKLLEFRYDLHPRVVEPMCLGEVETGRWELRAQQVGGSSSTSRSFPDGVPRLFKLAKMIDASVLPASFDIPGFYARGDKAFIRIDAQL